jgi:hypothetical protein
MALTDGQIWTLYLLMGMQDTGTQDSGGHEIYNISKFRTDAQSYAATALAGGDPNPSDTGFRSAVRELNAVIAATYASTPQINLSYIGTVASFADSDLRTALGVPYGGGGPCPTFPEAAAIYNYLYLLP